MYGTRSSALPPIAANVVEPLCKPTLRFLEDLGLTTEERQGRGTVDSSDDILYIGAMKNPRFYRQLPFGTALLAAGILLSACISDSGKDSVNADIVTINGVKHVGDFAPSEVGMKWAYACSSYHTQSRQYPWTTSHKRTDYELEVLELADSGMFVSFHEKSRSSRTESEPEIGIIGAHDTAYERDSLMFLPYHVDEIAGWWSPFAHVNHYPQSEVTEVVYDGKKRMQWKTSTGLVTSAYLSNLGLKSATYSSGGGGWRGFEECLLVAHSP